MMVAPVFATEISDGAVRSQCVGTCLYLAPSLAVTCDHVTGGRDQASLHVGVDKVPVVRVRRSTAADLALVELAAPRVCAPVVFSRQWRLDSLFAHGFPEAPFGVATSDGPLAPIRAMARGSSVRNVSFQIGTAKGFSGGPVVGTYGRRSYCVGLMQLGGTGYGVGVLIAADTVVAFVNHYQPGTASMVDLSYHALLEFLAGSHEQAARAWRDRGPQPSVLVTARGFADTTVPMVALEKINRTARPSLEAEQVPAQVGLVVSASDLSAILLGSPEHHPISVILQLVAQARAPLRFTEALRVCMKQGALALIVTDYPGFRGGPPDEVTKFLMETRKYLATQRSQSGGNRE